MLRGLYALFTVLPTESVLPRMFGGFSTFSLSFVLCFAIGVLLSFIRHDLPKMSCRFNRDKLALTALALLICWRTIFPNRQPALIIKSLVAAVIVYDVYYRKLGSIRWFCNLKFVKYIGEISYSLYVNALIYTFIAGVALKAVFPESFIAVHSLAFNLLGCAVTFWLDMALSTLTYRYIGRPFMTSGQHASIQVSSGLLRTASGRAIAASEA